MKTNCRHITFLLLCIPIGVCGQQSGGQKLDFYTELAFKDALYEHSFTLSAIEDELDYWKDQRNYEKSLKKKDLWAYQIYLNGKQKAYNQYRSHCSDSCEHSDYYFRRASYYAVNASSTLNSDVALSQQRPKK